VQIVVDNSGTNFVVLTAEGHKRMLFSLSKPRRLSENREPIAEKLFWRIFPTIFVK